MKFVKESLSVGISVAWNKEFIKYFKLEEAGTGNYYICAIIMDHDKLKDYDDGPSIIIKQIKTDCLKEAQSIFSEFINQVNED